MPIDTDDLSEKTYNAIIFEAEKFNHDLTLRFGLLSYHSNNENDFIDKSKLLIGELLKFDNEELNDMFFGNPPLKKEFHIALNKILDNIK